MRDVAWGSNTANPQIRALEVEVERRHRSVLHVSRKMYHLACGLFCFAMYAFVLSRPQALMVLGTVGGLMVVFDLARLKIPSVGEMAVRWFSRFMRSEELREFSANTYYVFGLLVVTLFFPKSIVLLSILCLAVGDPAAAMAGICWGRHRLFGTRKSWEGSLANFTAVGLVTLVVIQIPAVRIRESLAAAGATAFAGMIAEAIPARVDDNFTIPVLSALIIWGLNSLLQFL